MRAPDVVKWLEAEYLEMESTECYQTIQMTHFSISKLRGVHTMRLSVQAFPYKPKTLAKDGILLLDKRMIR